MITGRGTELRTRVGTVIENETRVKICRLLPHICLVHIGTMTVAEAEFKAEQETKLRTRLRWKTNVVNPFILRRPPLASISARLDSAAEHVMCVRARRARRCRRVGVACTSSDSLN
ncbi:hypothetical protein EVAR_94069_1 [Eumeta japonica]|uniref:Uncharacterized protein n=1 Tax=Eumeta variegata TaxID=151549 RepID=A0A4C1V6M1_EUMVA|nr:hypothetical protein EVAR_94069_1 [Eumeta japonica]